MRVDTELVLFDVQVGGLCFSKASDIVQTADSLFSVEFSVRLCFVFFLPLNS